MKLSVLFICLCTGVAAEATSGLADDAQQDDIDLESGTTIVILGDDEPDVLGQVVVDAKEAEKTAGLQGDALKAATVDGSVARNPGTSVGVSIWGAAPADTRIYVDGIPVPRLFHFGGTRSILPSSEVESFVLTSGGASARFGRGIGGVIEVRAPEPSWQDMRMHFRVDPIDVGGGFGARLGEGGSISFAGRSSLLPLGFRAVASEGAERVFAVPDYSDFQGRLSYDLPDGQKIQALAMLSLDDLTRSIPARIESESFSEESNAGFGRLALSLLREDEGGHRRLTLWVGRDAEYTIQDFGAVAAEDRVRRDTAGVLLVRKTPLSRDIVLDLGLDAEASRSRWRRAGAIALPAREGDVGVFGQPPGDRVNEDDWTVTMASVGLFSTMTFKIGPSLRIQPGVRLEPSVINGNRVLPVRPSEPEVGYSRLQWSLGPRGRIAYEAGPLAVFASGGRYSQAPAAADLSPVFGSPVLERAQSWQLLLGAQLQPWRDLRLGLQGFVAQQSNLAVRAEETTPAIASLLTSRGEGRTRGAQLSVEAQLNRNARVAAHYTLMKSERRNPDQRWRLFDLDQRHTIRASAQWNTDSGMTLAARAELTSGFPRTPVTGSIFNTRSQRFDPIFGVQNSERLPLFAELSLRVGYEGALAWGRYRMWLDVGNATNRKNAQERYYSADYMRTSYVRGLPILPLLGAELKL